MAASWLTEAAEFWTARALRRARPGSIAMHFNNFRGEVQNWGRRGKLPGGVSVKTYVSAVFGRLRDSPLLSVTADGRFLLSAVGELALKEVLAAQALDEQHAQSDAGASATEARAATEVDSAHAHTQPVLQPLRSAPIASPAGLVRLGPLESLLAAIEPPPECLQGHAVALEELRSVIRRRDSSVERKKGKGRMIHKLEGAVFVAYGSSVCGFANRGSDLDVELQPVGERAKAARLLYNLKQVFLADAQFSSRLVGPVEVVAAARVPVARLQLLQPSGGTVRVEVTASNGRGYFKSAVLGVVADGLPVLRPLVRIVKAWARAWGLNEAYSGGLNSFSLSLLCIFYCQSAGLMPPLAAVLCDDPTALLNEELARMTMGEAAGPLRRACDQLTDLFPVRVRAESPLLWERAQQDTELLPLLTSFFDWWQQVIPRMRSGECVQPLTGRWGSAATLVANSRSPTQLVVEDPFDAEENAARNLKRDSNMARRLNAAIKDALAKLSAGRVDKLLVLPSDAPPLVPPEPELFDPVAAVPLRSRNASQMNKTAQPVVISTVLTRDGAEGDYASFTLSLPWPLEGTPVLDVRVPRPAGVEAALAWLIADPSMRQPVTLLGLDVETDNFDDTALVQLSTAGRCVLVRLFSRSPLGASASAALRALCVPLNDQQILKVGCELRADAVALLHDTGLRARLRNGLDVSPALLRPGGAGARGHVFGLVDAFNMRHGTALVKDTESTFSDWAAENLTDAQMQYAALDAWMSYRLGCDKRLVQNPLAVRVDLGGDLAELADAGMLARKPRRVKLQVVAS